MRQLFVPIVTAATCGDIVSRKQGKSKKDRDVTVYILNEALINHHVKLNDVKKRFRKAFAPGVVDKFTFQALAEGDQFLDDDVDAALDA